MTSNQSAETATWIMEIQGHKWLAARALLTGWGLWTIFILWILPFFVGGNIGVAIVPSHPIGTAWTILTAPVGIQASLDRPFSFALAFGLPLIVWTVCGWLVAASHRGQRAGAVLLFAGSILLVNVVLIWPYSRGGFGPYLSAGQLAANAVASIVGVLLGGGLLHKK